MAAVAPVTSVQGAETINMTTIDIEHPQTSAIALEASRRGGSDVDMKNTLTIDSDSAPPRSAAHSGPFISLPAAAGISQSSHDKDDSSATDLKKALPKNEKNDDAKSSKKPSQKKEDMSKERRQWVTFCNIMSFYLPDFLLKFCGLKDKDTRQAWREKWVLCLLIFLASATMIFWLEGVGRLICPPSKLIALEAFTSDTADAQQISSQLVIVNGKIYNPTLSIPAGSGVGVGLFLSPYLRSDATSALPLMQRAFTSNRDSVSILNEISRANLDATKAWFWISNVTTNMYIVHSGAYDCLAPSSWPSNRYRGKYGTTYYVPYVGETSGDPNNAANPRVFGSRACITSDSSFDELAYYYVGDLLFQPTYLLSNSDGLNYLFAIDYEVFNMDGYFQYTSGWGPRNLDNNTADPNMYPVLDWLPTEVNTILQSVFQNNRTRQISSADFPFLTQDVMSILRKVFHAGVLANPADDVPCQVSNIILWATSAVVYGIVFLKFMLSLKFGTYRKPDYQNSFVVMFVPCYTEGVASLKKTIDSLSVSDYDDHRKLLWVLCDGNIKGAGNDKTTPRIALDILGWEGPEPEAKSYVALGEGTKVHNMAKVYTGIYTWADHQVPYIVVVKVGKPSEMREAKPGNRGKRDSQLIILNFIQRLVTNDESGNSIMFNPLEFELYRSINEVLKVNPRVYEYALMVDADTEVAPDALNRMIAKMKSDQRVIALCGETKVANEKQSWVTAVQVYEYFISHHVGKAFESLFGTVTCLPGCFSMYRLKSLGTVNVKSGPVAYVVHPNIIKDYSLNRVDTLHLKNLLHLGEDRYLTTLMLKHFPEMKLEFLLSATCWTIIPDDISVLLSQRRRWINSTLHNLWELFRLPGLCGFCLFSMRFVVLMDLISTVILPVGTCYLYYIIVCVILDGVEKYLVVVLGFACLYACQILIFMLKMEFQYLGWLLLYLIIGLPLFNIVLPLYAFWHFDEFSWGSTRKIETQEQKKLTPEEKALEEKKRKDEEIFDRSPVPAKSLYEWEHDAYIQVSGDKYAPSDDADDKVSLYSGFSERPHNMVIRSNFVPKDTFPDSGSIREQPMKQPKYVDAEAVAAPVSVSGVTPTHDDLETSSVVTSNRGRNPKFTEPDARPARSYNSLTELSERNFDLAAEHQMYQRSPNVLSPASLPTPTEDEIVWEINHLVETADLRTLDVPIVIRYLSDRFHAPMHLQQAFIAESFILLRQRALDKMRQLDPYERPLSVHGRYQSPERLVATSRSPSRPRSVYADIAVGGAAGSPSYDAHQDGIRSRSVSRPRLDSSSSQTSMTHSQPPLSSSSDRAQQHYIHQPQPGHHYQGYAAGNTVGYYAAHSQGPAPASASGAYRNQYAPALSPTSVVSTATEDSMAAISNANGNAGVGAVPLSNAHDDEDYSQIYLAVKDFVQTADLNVTTKRQIREAMIARFGAEATPKINTCITEVLRDLSQGKI